MHKMNRFLLIFKLFFNKELCFLKVHSYLICESVLGIEIAFMMTIHGYVDVHGIHRPRENHHKAKPKWLVYMSGIKA